MTKMIASLVSVSQQRDAELSANCLTVGRFGAPKEGIAVSLNRGPDQFRPWTPHILVGGYRVHRDDRDGFVFVKSADGTTATVRRAVVHHVTPEGKRDFYTLKQPAADKPQGSIVKVSTALPMTKKVVMNGWELRLFTGVGGGTLIGYDGGEALVELLEGQALTVFYEDGAVRVFRRQGAYLEEVLLTPCEMLEARIHNAWDRLDEAEKIKDDDRRTRIIHGILAGMADLIHLTTKFDKDGAGQEMRRMLLAQLFLQLSDEALERCFRKVEATLHQVDPVLVPMLRGGSFITSDLPSGVADLDKARRDRERAQRESAREARRQERLSTQPKKGSGGNKEKATTNPKKQAKIQRKLAQRKA